MEANEVLKVVRKVSIATVGEDREVMMQWMATTIAGN